MSKNKLAAEIAPLNFFANGTQGMLLPSQSGAGWEKWKMALIYLYRDKYEVFGQLK